MKIFFQLAIVSLLASFSASCQLIPWKPLLPGDGPTRDNSAPRIIDFRPDRPRVPGDGRSVILTWYVENAETVRILPGIGTVATRGAREIPLRNNSTTSMYREFTLIAKNATGEEVQKTVSVEVLPMLIPPPPKKLPPLPPDQNLKQR